MKRYLIFPTQFDTRSHTLQDAQEQWEPRVKELHLENKKRLIELLRHELGEQDFEAKLNNFIDFGHSPFSIIAHHNVYFHQARYAFIHGFYYPALTSACALGERILNHLFLDMRAYFPRSSIDKKSHTRKSIDDWVKAIAVLEDWKVFQHAEVNEAFEKLMDLRHKSLHFSRETNENVRGDALKALHYLSTVIEKQFGFQQTNVISGSKGAFFLTKQAEINPFLKHYYVPQCACVSPYYRMRNENGIWLVFDHIDVGTDEVSDEEFLRLFTNRDDEQLALDDIPWSENVCVVALLPDGARAVDYDPEKATQSADNDE